MTTTAVRPQALPVEVADCIDHVTLFWLREAIDNGDDHTDLMADLVDELTALQEEFPEDWEHLMPCGPAEAAERHLAALQATRI